MSVLVVGSVALDTVETPYGREREVLGGSATYFSVACSRFAPVKLVGVVGDDFPSSSRSLLESRGVDLAGLEVVPGRTLRWGGAYRNDMNEAVTDFIHLNVFENYHPRLPEEYRDSEYVFLANIGPDLQIEVLDQISSPRLVVGDTMNFWLENTLDRVREM
nr:sugar kinase [bacterium]